MPAIVYNRAYDVLASNAIGDALFHDWAHSRNLLHVVSPTPSRAPSTGPGTRSRATASPGSGITRSAT
ncbi:hypothetical protein [Actinomadura bangladeshensis]|uniref:MmyB family transcriptional regulator n=1 Tax=Actinomadura bangladeshensis TaxID=453573 RepID=UPI001FB78868|nr:hypothetical protein [Actinomadura bangladeshensis]